MKTSIDFIGDIVILALKGELDSRGNAVLDRQLRDLSDKRYYKILLDVSAIRFIGNQTISMLLSNMKEMRAGGGDIKLLSPDKSVLLHLKKNRMIELLEVFSTKTEAIKSFNSTQLDLSDEAINHLNIRSSQLKPTMDDTAEHESRESFDSSSLLYANSCMLVSLIKLLQQKGVLSTEEAQELLDFEKISLKGVHK